MDFEQAYENYKNGTATDEEKAYIKDEIAKAKKLSLIIDEIDASKEVIAPTDIQDVKKAKRKHGVTSAVLMIGIVFCCLILSAGAICGGIFGQAFSSAKSNTVINETEAEAIAIDFLVTNGYATDQTKVIITDRTEREIVFTSNLTHCYYEYIVEVQTDKGAEYEIKVDGKKKLADFDRYDD